MSSRLLARCGMALGALALLVAAPQAQAVEPMAPASAPTPTPTGPLATDWLRPAPLLPGPTDDPSCRADSASSRSVAANTAAQIARVRALLAAEAAQAPSGAGEVRVLNNRGYNYGSSALVDPSLIEFEANRQRGH